MAKRPKSMSSGDAETLLKRYLPTWQSNRDRIDRVDRWYRGDLEQKDLPKLPAGSNTPEYRELRDRAVTPWLKYVVRSLTQGLYVEGYRRSDNPENLGPWEAWQRNGMDARQIPVHRSAMAHAVSYETILPGDPFPVIRGHSARNMITLYDQSNDEWPIFAIRGEEFQTREGRKGWAFTLYDEVARYTFHAEDSSGSKLEYITLEEHNAGVCPVVRFVNEIDLEGRVDGEVEPYIDMAARIDQDTFDRLVVQRFGAWLVRWIAGMNKPATNEEREAEKLRLRIDSILVTDNPDAKFGVFPATPLDGYINARDSDIRDLAVVTQTPPADLLGQMINLSAEALAAAEASRTRKWQERKHTFGEAHEQALRLVAQLMGDQEGAQDFSAQVVWRDMESRSLAQAADALGKLASMLDLPVEVLWEKVPGLTQQDIERAKEIRDSAGGIQSLLEQISAAQQPPAPAPVPAPGPPAPASGQ